MQNQTLVQTANRAVQNNRGSGQMSPIMGLNAMLEKSEKQLEILLGDKTPRFKREFLTMVRESPAVLECEPKGVIGCAIKAAQLNLSLDKTLGQAYIVPRYNSRAGYKEATFQVGYQGLLEMARRSGEIQSIFANVVFEGDEFKHEYSLEGAVFKHVPVPPSMRSGKKIGAYVVAKLTNGGTHFEWMWAEEIEKIKRLSKAKSGPWKDFEEEMWKKTVIRRASKYLPFALEDRQVIRNDELQEVAVQRVDYSPLAEGKEEIVIDNTSESTTAA